MINAYVMGPAGDVIYDSQSKVKIGKNFSKKEEIVAILDKQQENGIRSEPLANDPFSHRYYVSAVIKNFADHPIGLVSVSQSVKSSLYFIPIGKDKIEYMVAYFFVGAIVLAFLFSYWLSRPIRGLTNYAQAVTKGENSRPPKTSFRDFRSLGRAFEDMRITLEKKESIKNYVNDVTHALKSPLSAIKATAEIFQNEVPRDKVHLFSHIEAEADRASKLLNDLLEVACLESRGDLINVENLHLKELMKETLSSLEPLIKKKNIKMRAEWGSSEFCIKGEQFLILQVFENLILNAIDFSPVEGEITIETIEDKKTIQIFVRDQGPGIPEYARERIFEKFYSLERPSGKKSTGLGLTFAREAVLLHRGKIQLEPSSSDMRGANFKILFSKN